MSQPYEHEMHRFNDQFRETPDERNERLRQRRLRTSIATLQKLVADMSSLLTDEGDTSLSPAGLDELRRRTANAIPPDKCPDWLKQYRDPLMVQS